MPTTTPPANCFEKLANRGFEYHAFISWPNQIDSAAAKLVKLLHSSLEDRLKRHHMGGRVFLDTINLRTGEVLSEAIRRSVCRSGLLIVILIDPFFLSEYCKTEWSIIEQLQESRLPQNHDQATCFIPILLGCITPLPTEIKEIVFERCRFKEILTSGRVVKSNPKWTRAIDYLFETIEKRVALMCRVQDSAQDWKRDEQIALTAKAKKFTWPDPQPEEALPPRLPRLPPIIGDGSKLR